MKVYIISFWSRGDDGGERRLTGVCQLGGDHRHPHQSLQ